MHRWMFCLGVLSGVAAVCAQEGNSSRTDRTVRAARDAARERLINHVKTLPITDTTTVGEFVREDQRLELALAESLRQANTIGRPREYTGGSVEVDVQVSIAWVVEQLQHLHARFYRGDRVKATDFAEMARRNADRGLVFTGSAMHHAASDGHPPPERPGATPRPAGWQWVTDQGMSMARRAAEIDGVRKLTERIAGLELTNTPAVKDFLAENAQMQPELNAFLTRATFGEPNYTSERVCTVTTELTVDALIAQLVELRARHYRGDRVTDKKIQALRQALDAPVIRVTGSGIAPPIYVRRPSRAEARPPLPAWARGVLRATGQGGTPNGDYGPELRRRLAEAAAFVEAHRKIAQQIDAMEITPSVTVADLLADHDWMQRDVATYLTAVHKTAVIYAADGQVTITVELPLERLGYIVQSNR